MATCYPADRGDGGPFDDGVSECFADVNKGFMYKMMVNNCYFLDIPPGYYTQNGKQMLFLYIPPGYCPKV